MKTEISYSKKIMKLSVVVIFIFLSNILSYGQCTWSSILNDSFEYTTVCPDVIPGISYSANPDIYASNSGSYSLYLNFKDSIFAGGTNAGTLFYKKTVAICPNLQYKISAWFATTFAGQQCNIKIVIKDASGAVLNSNPNFSCPYAPTWSQYSSGIITPTTNSITIELTTNVGGCGGNDLGMDDLLIEQCFTNINTTTLTTLCKTASQSSLYNLITPTTPTYGTWSGPSSLSGGYLGTLTPSLSLSGSYNYSFFYQNNSNCPLVQNLVNVIINPTPIVTVNSLTICAGASATLTAAGATSYSWSNSAITSSININPIINTVYTVTGSVSGCSSSASSTVSIITAPLIATNNATICNGQSVTLTTSGAITYTWSPAATLSSSTGSIVIANPLTTTVYSIIGSVGTCTASGTSTVIVNPNPAVTSSASNSIICLGNSTSLTGGGASTYTWSGGITNGAIFSPTTTSSYTVTGSSISGCTNTAVQTITVNATPTIMANGLMLCSGETGTLTVLTTSAVSNYSWSPSVALSSSTGSVVVANPTVTTVYSITGSIGTCTALGTITVTVNPNPTVTASASNSIICLGNSTSLTGGGASTYTWSNGVIDGAIFSPTVTSTYSVTGASVSGCTNTAVQTIIVGNAPTVSIISSSICAGQSATLMASAAPLGGTFTWSLGGQTTPSISESPSNTTVYGVLYSANGCTAIATGTIVVNPNPNVVISASSNTISALETVNISATGGSIYSWSSGQSSSIINVNPLITTNYCVNVTSTQGCLNTSCITITIIDVSSLYAPNVFTPNGDGVNDIYFTPGHNILDYDLNIFNRWGQIIFSSTDLKKGWDGTFNGTIVSDGVYVYILKAKGVDNVDYKLVGHITVFK